MILSSCQGQLVAESWPSDSDFIGFERYLTIGLPSYCLGHDSYKAAKPQPPISIPVPSMWPMGTKGLSSTPRTPAWSREICWEAQVASCEASSAPKISDPGLSIPAIFRLSPAWHGIMMYYMFSLYSVSVLGSCLYKIAWFEGYLGCRLEPWNTALRLGSSALSVQWTKCQFRQINT
jgi:hypothetical protein